MSGSHSSPETRVCQMTKPRFALFPTLGSEAVRTPPADPKVEQHRGQWGPGLRSAGSERKTGKGAQGP